MLSKTKIRKILGNNKLTAEDLESLRHEMYTLAEIFFEEMQTSNGSKKPTWVIDTKGKNNEH